MARTLTLRFLGNDIVFYIPDLDKLDEAFYADTANQAWTALFGRQASPNMPVHVGFAINQTLAAFTEYYQFIASMFGPSGHNTHNMYMAAPASHTWDTQWPSDDILGPNKILLPPSVEGNWICPANGRYVTFSRRSDTAVTAIVYDSNNVRISESAYQYMSFTESVSVVVGVSNWDSFRHASTFSDARNYCAAVAMSNRTNGQIWVRSNPELYTFLQVLWDLVRVREGDDDDPTTEPSDDPYSGDDSPYAPGGEGGGDGDGADPYDPGDDVPYPDDPDVGLSDSGLLGVYTPSSAQLHLLGGYIWSQNFVDSLVKSVYADPMDVIISIGVVPFNIPAAGTRDVKVGDRIASFGETTVRSNYPASDYFNYDCGTVKLDSTIGCYLDYQPYTKGHIFIPFVGFVPLDIDYYMGKTIGLKYKVELVTGTAVAILTANGKVMQHFTCNVKMLVPLTSANATQMWDSLLKTTMAAGALVATGGAAGGVVLDSGPAALSASGPVPAWELTSGSISNKDAANITNGIVTKPNFQKSNPHGVSGGFVASKQKPYIIVERPNMQLPTNQGQYTGYGAYATKKLADLSGFTRVSSSKLSLPNATGKEMIAIRKTLHEGVFINGTPSIPNGDLVLMKNNSPANTIGKSTTSVSVLTGTFRDEASVSELTIRIERNDPTGFNYLYCSKFGRFYFVNEITVVRTGILDLHCTVDELDSFAADILANTAIIDKQEKEFNLYLNDDGLKVQQNPLVQTWNFPHGFGEGYEYVMVVAGYQGGS